MSAPNALPLEAWSRFHAVVMLCAAPIAAGLGTTWPLPACAIPSFLVLLYLCRHRYTPRGGFGPANAVTALRFTLIAATGLALHDVNGWLYCAVIQLIFALDGVDGWVARKTGSASPFGAHFDMESDAVLVLLLGIELWQRERLGGWAVVPGLMRYLFVLCVTVFPVRRSGAPGGNFSRRAFVGLLIGFPLAFIVPGVVGTTAAALGAALIGVSFGRSLLWSYGSPLPPAPSAS
jgi:phosphatidylglycerophosphate synthase